MESNEHSIGYPGTVGQFNLDLNPNPPPMYKRGAKGGLNHSMGNEPKQWGQNKTSRKPNVLYPRPN